MYLKNLNRRKKVQVLMHFITSNSAFRLFLGLIYGMTALKEMTWRFKLQTKTMHVVHNHNS